MKVKIPKIGATVFVTCPERAIIVKRIDMEGKNGRPLFSGECIAQLKESDFGNAIGLDVWSYIDNIVKDEPEGLCYDRDQYDILKRRRERKTHMQFLMRKITS
jgi:hypothetical protein